MGKTSEATTDEHIDAWQDDLTALKFDKKLVDVAIDDLRNDKDLTLDEAAKKLNSYFNQVDNGQIDYDDQVALSQKEDENGDGFITANMENTTLELPNDATDSSDIQDETGILDEFFNAEGEQDYEDDPELFKDDLLDFLAELIDADSKAYQELEDVIDRPHTSYVEMKDIFKHIAGDDNILTQDDLNNYDIKGTEAIARREDAQKDVRETDLKRLQQHLDFGVELLEDGGEGTLQAAEEVKQQLPQSIRSMFLRSPDVSKAIIDFIENNNFEKVLAFFDDLQTLSGTDELELEDFDVLKDGNFNINDDGSILLGG